MNQNHASPGQLAGASLLMLAVLQITMLLAMMTLTRPHPPLSIPPFALGPFLGAGIAIAIGAFAVGSVQTRLGWWASFVAGLLAMVSFGPHKWIDPLFAQIWPAVILGQLAFAGIILAMFNARGPAPAESPSHGGQAA